MKPMSDGFATAPQQINVEETINAINCAKMRFLIRASPGTRSAQEVNFYFPSGTQLTQVPDELLGAAWPWGGWDDPFFEISVSVDAARASYLAPAIHLNHYLDWLLFDFECEQGKHRVEDYENRPSNIARRSYFEVFVHSVLIALKSALDRLVAVIAHYVGGISPHMTWGRIKKGRSSGFMSVVERGRENDSLLDFLHTEYHAWISQMVAPRDDIIHYADLQTSWQFYGLPEDEQGPMLGVIHASSRGDQSAGFDSQMLHSYVNAFYALADRVLLTLATRLPLSVRKKLPSSGGSLGSAIMAAFDLPPSKLVGELKKVIEQAIKDGEIEGEQELDFYIAFLRQNAVRFGLPAS